MSALVLHFCGPHRDGSWSPLYHRLEAAVHVAREECAPLLVVGDAYGGRAVEHFVAFARERGIEAVGAFDPGARTLSDVYASLLAIHDRSEFAVVDRVFVVTDDWHVERCLEMLRGERDRFLPGRPVRFLDRSTAVGPRPPAWVLDGERRGIRDYLAGNPYAPFGEPFGKPAHPTGGNTHAQPANR